MYNPANLANSDNLDNLEETAIVDTTAKSEESDKSDHLLTPREVAQLFRVSPKTVSRWADVGKLSEFRTLGGHRRFWASEILDALAQNA